MLYGRQDFGEAKIRAGSSFCEMANVSLVKRVKERKILSGSFGFNIDVLEIKCLAKRFNLFWW